MSIYYQEGVAMKKASDIVADEDVQAASKAYWRGLIGRDGFMRAAVEAAAVAIAARVWDEAYESGVADAWTSMHCDGGQTPAARANPYRTDVS